MHRVDLRHDAFFIVRLIGLEPTQPELPDPKSGVSTNFTTGAVLLLAKMGCASGKSK